jgi:hypothetical protein
MKDWVEWHQDYDSPGTSLARRLQVVRSRLEQTLDAVGSDAVVLSLCAGDGRDLIGILNGHADRVGRAVLVERDEVLAGRARDAAASSQLPMVEVRCRDAGAVESFADVLPVDVLMLCGIFGNIEHAQIRIVISLLPCLLREGGYIIWTRGGSEPDRRPEVRHWFSEAGLEEMAFDGAPETYGVGLSRMARSALSQDTLPSRLFRFS